MPGRICSVKDVLQMIGAVTIAETRNDARRGERLQRGRRGAKSGQSKPGSRRPVMRKAGGLPGAAGGKARQRLQADKAL